MHYTKEHTDWTYERDTQSELVGSSLHAKSENGRNECILQCNWKWPFKEACHNYAITVLFISGGSRNYTYLRLVIMVRWV